MTGAARGIGLAAAQSLALLGAKVLMVDNGCAVDGSPEDSAVTELAAERVPGATPLVIDLAAPGSGARDRGGRTGGAGRASTWSCTRRVSSCPAARRWRAGRRSSTSRGWTCLRRWNFSMRPYR